MAVKGVRFPKAARQRVLRGIDTLRNAVKVTLGHGAIGHRSLRDASEVRSVAARDVVARDVPNSLLEVQPNRLRNPAGRAEEGMPPHSLPEHWLTQATAKITVNGRGGSIDASHVDVRFQGDAAMQNQVLNFDGLTEIASAPGQVWTLVVRLGLVSGNLANATRLTLRLRGGRDDGTFRHMVGSENLVGAVPGPGVEPATFVVTGSPAGDNMAAVVGGIVVDSSGPFDFTLRLAGLAQHHGAPREQVPG